MQVTVKMFGALRHFLPPGSSFNSCQMTLPEDLMLGDLLPMLAVPVHKAYLVIVNDTKINPQDYASTPVSRDDEIVLLPPIKGG